MEEKKEEAKKKLSYEELEQYATQMSMQAQQLYAALQEKNVDSLFKRLDYLFKVIENEEAFSPDFTMKCIEEIESIMTVPEKESEKEK